MHKEKWNSLYGFKSYLKKNNIHCTRHLNLVSRWDGGLLTNGSGFNVNNLEQSRVMFRDDMDIGGHKAKD